MSSKTTPHLLAFALSVAAFAAPALAGDQAGKVALVGGDIGNPFVFTISGTRTSTPSCATDSNWVIPSPSSDNAKALLSLVLTAFAANKTVTVHGNGGCNATFTNREEVGYLFIQ